MRVAAENQQRCPMMVINPGLLQNKISTETYHTLKSRENMFVSNILFIYPIVSKFCIEQGSDIAVLYTKFQSDRALMK